MRERKRRQSKRQRRKPPTIRHNEGRSAKPKQGQNRGIAGRAGNRRKEGRANDAEDGRRLLGIRFREFVPAQIELHFNEDAVQHGK